MLMENGGDVILCGGAPPDTLAFCLGVLHTAFHARPYHRQLQLAEHASHLEKCFAHRVGLPVPAVDGDASHNDQPQMLGAYYLYQFAQLLCASAQSADVNVNENLSQVLTNI